MTTAATTSDIDEVKLEPFALLEDLIPHLENEQRILHKNGAYHRWFGQELAVRDTEGDASHADEAQIDLSDHRLTEKQLLHYYAFHDELTGLPNRVLFMDRLGRAVERAKRREDYLFAVLFVDFDDFKAVNDNLGHMIGDQLLIASARRLEACLRAVDTVARIGGDEFVILLEDIQNASDTTRVVNRIQAELALPFSLNGHKASISASIGIALSETGYDRAEDMLRDADIAMYRAKVLGKARYEVFDPAMRARAVARLAWETNLRRALERREFRIHYQPIVSLETGWITGFEALLRWQHPERGLISPAEFISVAEETGLIIPLGQWVLREACRQMREWQRRFPTDPPLTISVNLSGEQFAQPDLVEQVQRILHGVGLDARSLSLEITEGVLMEHGESATTTLSQLCALGVAVQIDDFGTGYSSLGYLQCSPLNAIKIDHTFVSRMGMDGSNSEIVQTIVTLAHNLGMDVIAEGVETAEQLAQLRALKCEYGQGYHISEPRDSHMAGALVAKSRRWCG